MHANKQIYNMQPNKQNNYTKQAIKQNKPKQQIHWYCYSHLPAPSTSKLGFFECNKLSAITLFSTKEGFS